MSENNDGGLAERGGGGLANPGGPNTAGGGGGQANRSGMGLGVNSGNGWVNNPYVNSATSGGLGATLAAYQQAQARARAKAKAAAAAAGVVTPTTPAPVDPITGIPIPQPKPAQAYGYYAGPGMDLYNSNIYSNVQPGTGPIAAWGDQHGIGYGGAGEYNSGGIGAALGDGPGGTIGKNQSTKDQSRLQFGGPAEPGQTYTVGENGPETLQMNAQGGGGQVIPHNPMDRLGGMNPQMMQQLFQMQRQFGGGRGQPQQQAAAAQPPAPPSSPTMPPTPQPQQGGPGNPGGGWQQRMGIEGLSRPRGPQPGGFGLSGLGQPGVMGQLRRQGGLAG